MKKKFTLASLLMGLLSIALATPAQAIPSKPNPAWKITCTYEFTPYFSRLPYAQRMAYPNPYVTPTRCVLTRTRPV